MDEKTFNEKARKLREIDQVIKSLDPSIRESSFRLLQSYVTEKGGEETANPGQKEMLHEEKSEEDFFLQFSSAKPSDNLSMIVAYFYSKYGTHPITYQEIKEKADTCGVTIPNRIDMTLKVAKRNKKNLFALRPGKVCVTVHGEKYLKETFNVTKGRKKKEDEVEL